MDSQNFDGIADAAQQHRDRDQRADRHQQLPWVHPESLAQLGWLGLDCRGRGRTEIVECVVTTRIERVTRDPRQRVGLQQRERRDQLVTTDVRQRDLDGKVVPRGRGRRCQELRDVVVALAITGVRRRAFPTHHRDLGVTHDQVIGIETTVRQAGSVNRGGLRPGVVEHGTCTRVAFEVAQRRALDLVDHEQGERALTSRVHDVGNARPELRGEEHHVRLELDLAPTGGHQHRWCVAIGDPAPHPRQELRVGFVSTQRDHAHRTIGADGSEHRPAHRLFAGRAHLLDRDSELVQRVGHLPDRRPARRRAEREVHERRRHPTRARRRRPRR